MSETEFSIISPTLHGSRPSRERGKPDGTITKSEASELEWGGVQFISTQEAAWHGT